jgi:hypothetical protein
MLRRLADRSSNEAEVRDDPPSTRGHIWVAKGQDVRGRHVTVDESTFMSVSKTVRQRRNNLDGKGLWVVT